MCQRHRAHNHCRNRAEWKHSEPWKITMTLIMFPRSWPSGVYEKLAPPVLHLAATRQISAPQHRCTLLRSITSNMPHGELIDVWVGVSWFKAGVTKNLLAAGTSSFAFSLGEASQQEYVNQDPSVFALCCCESSCSHRNNAAASLPELWDRGASIFALSCSEASLEHFTLADCFDNALNLLTPRLLASGDKNRNVVDLLR